MKQSDVAHDHGDRSLRSMKCGSRSKNPETEAAKKQDLAVKREAAGEAGTVPKEGALLGRIRETEETIKDGTKTRRRERVESKESNHR